MNAAAIGYRCALCQDRHRFYSVGLKRKIACPRCSRGQRHDASGLRALAQTEREHREREQIKQARELAQALEFAERVASRTKELDPMRAPTDRIMQRWAAGEGSDLPPTDEAMERLVLKAIDQPDTFTAPPAKSPPLDNETQIIVNGAWLRSPAPIKWLVFDWYRGPLPVSEIAKEHGVSRQYIYTRWHGALDYLRERFVLTGSPTLLQLLRSPA